MPANVWALQKDESMKKHFGLEYSEANASKMNVYICEIYIIIIECLWNRATVGFIGLNWTCKRSLQAIMIINYEGFFLSKPTEKIGKATIKKKKIIFLKLFLTASNWKWLWEVIAPMQLQRDV